ECMIDNRDLSEANSEYDPSLVDTILYPDEMPAIRVGYLRPIHSDIFYIGGPVVHESNKGKRPRVEITTSSDDIEICQYRGMSQLSKDLKCSTRKLILAKDSKAFFVRPAEKVTEANEHFRSFLLR